MKAILKIPACLLTAAGLPEGGVVVNVREGNYRFLDNPFTLENEDSGTPSSPIVYRNYADLVHDSALLNIFTDIALCHQRKILLCDSLRELVLLLR